LLFSFVGEEKKRTLNNCTAFYQGLLGEKRKITIGYEILRSSTWGA